MKIKIEIFGSMYGAGPNIRPGCVASITDEGYYTYEGDDLGDLPAAFEAWLHTPVSEKGTTYPRRYLKFVEYKINGGQRRRTLMDLPAEMETFMSRLREEVA